MIFNRHTIIHKEVGLLEGNSTRYIRMIFLLPKLRAGSQSHGGSDDFPFQDGLIFRYFCCSFFWIAIDGLLFPERYG